MAPRSLRTLTWNQARTLYGHYPDRGKMPITILCHGITKMPMLKVNKKSTLAGELSCGPMSSLWALSRPAGSAYYTNVLYNTDGSQKNGQG